MTSEHIQPDGEDCKPGKRKSTRSAPWYKRYPGDYLRGTRQLSLAARGAYSDLLDLMFIEDGGLPNDDMFIACALHIKQRQWRAVRKQLVDAGKIFVGDDRLIHNRRADDEIKDRNVRVECSSSARRRNVLGKKFNVINGGRSIDTEADTDLSIVRAQQATLAEDAAAASAKKLFDQLQSRLTQAAGDALASPATAPGLLNLSVPASWLDQGCDLERDIVPAIAEMAANARRRGMKIKSWVYFAGGVAEHRDRRLQPLPAVTNQSRGTAAKIESIHEFNRLAYGEGVSA